MKLFKIFEKKSSGNLIAVSSLIVSTFALIWGLCNSQRTSIIENQLLAYQYQPRLSPTRTPHIKEVRTATEFFNPDSLRQKSIDPISNKPTVELRGKLSITSQLFLKNSGNALAKIFGYVQTDTTSFAPMIRESFLRSIRDGDSVSVTELESVNELLPGDSTVLTLQHDVVFFDSSQFTLHYLVLYENELGNLYDTFIWSRFAINDFPMNVQVVKADTQQFMRIIYPKIKAGDLIVPLGSSNDSYFTYDKMDAEQIRSFFEKLRSRHKKQHALTK